MSQLAHERGPRPFKVVWHDTVQALDVWSCCHATSRALRWQGPRVSTHVGSQCMWQGRCMTPGCLLPDI